MNTETAPVSPGAAFLGSDFFKQCYTDEEKDFLVGFLQRHAAIASKFDAYAALSPDQRLEAAKTDLATELRTGLVHLTSKNPPQTVAEHVCAMHEIAKKLNLDQPAVHEMIDIHDICEAIIGDVPNEKNGGVTGINREDKEHIERLAAKLLFEEYPEKHKIFLEYEERKTPLARLVKGIDALELTQYMLVLEEEAVTNQHKTNVFWRTSQNVLESLNGQLPREFQLLFKEYQDKRNSIETLYL